MLAASLCSAALASACLNPNTYSTPRTVPEGRIAMTTAIEAFDLRTRAPSAPDYLRRAYAPLPPSILIRLGLGERTDLGIDTMNLSTVGVDLKHNFERGDVDVAVDPGFQFQPITVGHEAEANPLVALHLPLLVGLNLSPELSLVGAAGATIVPVAARGLDVAFLGAAARDEVALARGTVGFDFRITQTVALHPEVTLLRGFSHETTLWIAGMGISMGRLPSFSP